MESNNEFNSYQVNNIQSQFEIKDKEMPKHSKNNNGLIIVIVMLIIVVLCLGGFIFFNREKLLSTKEPTPQNEVVEKDVVTRKYVYVKINPFVKLIYEEKYKMCNDKRCSDVTTNIVETEMLNDDATRIYENVDLKGLNVYDGIEKLINVAKENNINTDNVDLYYESEQFDKKEIQVDSTTSINEHKDASITEQKIEELKEEPVYHMVTFKDDSEEKIVTVKDGMVVANQGSRFKEGYTFIEWQLDGKAYDFSKPVTKDIVLTAKWQKTDSNNSNNNTTNTTEDELIITFDSDGGSNVPSQTIKKRGTVKEPTPPTKEGYTFVEWQLNGVTFHFNSKVIHNLTLKAKWTKNEVKKNMYTVSFDSNGGTSITNQTIEEGSKATKPSTPTKEGYTFVEWQLDNKAYDFNSSVTNNITLKAIWTQDPIPNYTITFDSDGGTSILSQTVAKGGVAIKPSNPTKKGYNFIEWQLNGSTYSFITKVTGDITLKAKWVAKVYKVKSIAIDPYSPDRTLEVYEDNVKISFKSIQYTDGTELCKSNNPTVSLSDISGETSFKVVLSDNTIVTAGLY